MTKTMTLYEASSIVEGFCGYEPSETQLNAAWQYLIDTGACWMLQGWYGRSAMALIEAGVCRPAKEDHKDYYGNIVPGKK